MKRVLVIAHDAGGAEVIAAYIASRKDASGYHGYVAGPAVAVFQRYGLPATPFHGERGELLEALERVRPDMVLTGTGWMTTIEGDAIDVAHEKGVRVVSYLESWVNYRERFGYPTPGWKRHLPDELWVGDVPAKEMAERLFLGIPVRLVPNQYFRSIARSYRALRGPKKHRQTQFLFLSDAVPGVELLLDAVCQHIKEHAWSGTLLVRLHPADPKDRYTGLIARYPEVRVRVQEGGTLEEALATVQLVLGAETVAMVASVLCRVPTLSLRITKGSLVLPFPEIVSAHTLPAFLRLLSRYLVVIS